MKLFVKTLIPLAVAGAAFSAHAVAIGPLSASAATPTTALETFSSAVSTGSFDFTLSTTSNLDVVVFSPMIDLGAGKTFSSMGVYGLFQGSTPLGEAAFNSPLTFSSLAPGSYSIDWAGVKTGTLGGAVGVAGFAVPVPEPETYAMLLAGLGMMGLIARRRSRQIH
jgi:hypothetical protein